MKTRSRGPKSAPAVVESPPEVTKDASLPPSETNPPKLFILPQQASSEARIVTLKNPATSAPSRYLACPDVGFQEFTKIAAPRSTPSSVLFAAYSPTDETVAPESNVDGKRNGYVAQSSDLFIATPIDPMFLMIPVLCPEAIDKKPKKQMFLSLDDHLESIGESSNHLKSLLRQPKLRGHLERAVEAACDSVRAGEETMYRLSKEKVLHNLLRKAQRLSQTSLPVSMEDRFIQRELEAPILSVKREDHSTSTTICANVTAKAHNGPGDTDNQMAVDPVISVETNTTSVVSQPEKTNGTTPQGQISTQSDVTTLFRTWTAFKYITISYLQPQFREEMRSMLSSQDAINFQPLHERLAYLASLKAEAQALRTVSDNVSGKRHLEDDEAIEARAEKKRKQDEEEMRKKTESRGVKELRKVNTKGMMKLSAFFAKAPPK